jgi:hypothetical protein
MSSSAAGKSQTLLRPSDLKAMIRLFREQNPQEFGLAASKWFLDRESKPLAEAIAAHFKKNKHRGFDSELLIPWMLEREPRELASLAVGWLAKRRPDDLADIAQNMFVSRGWENELFGILVDRDELDYAAVHNKHFGISKEDTSKKEASQNEASKNGVSKNELSQNKVSKNLPGKQDLR